MAIRFYSKSAAFSEFSNFAPFPIELDGLRWPTVEHYYQAQKFDDAAYREAIRNAKDPAKAKALGGARDRPMRTDWDAAKEAVMSRAVAAKFGAHRKLRALLLSTGDEELIEASAKDAYWGAGRDGSGMNKLGRILMEVREDLRRKKS